MPSLSSSNSVKVLISTEADTKGITQTEHALSGLNASSGMSAKSAALMGAVAGAAQVGVMALGGAVKSAAEAAIGGASSFEQNRVAFETMLGSADKARTLLTDISKFAKETPFELPEVVAASKQLLAYGIAQDKILPTLRKLGDVAAGVGVPVGQLSFVYGQVRVAGKMMAQDLNQFTNAGVPMLDYLSQVMHKTSAQIRSDMDTGVAPSFDQVNEALNLMTQNGSKFGGMMEKQSHTFGGVVSNIKDSFGQMLRAAVGVTNAGDIVQGGLFDKLKIGAEKVMPVMQNLANNVGAVMTKAMTDASTVARILYDTISGGDPTLKASETRFAGFVVAIIKIRDTLVQFLAPSLKALWSSLNKDLLPALKQFAPYMDDIAKILGGVLVAALWFVINGIRIWAKEISFVIDAWFAVKNAATETFNFISQVIAAFMQPFTYAFDIMRGVALATWGAIGGTVIGTWQSIYGVWSGVAGWFGRLWDSVSGAGGKAAGSVGSAFGGVAESIKNAFKVAINWVIDKLNGLVHGINNTAGKLPGVPKMGEVPRFETGMTNFQGGLAVINDKFGQGGEAVILPRGASVKTATQSRDMGGSQSTVTYNIQSVELKTAEATRAFFAISERNSVLAARGGSVMRPA